MRRIVGFVDLPDVDPQKPLVGQALAHQPGVIIVDDRIEHGAGKRPRPVVDFIRYLGQAARIAGEPDLPVSGEFGDAVQFVQDKKIAVAVAQQPVEAAVEMQERQQRDEIGARLVKRREIRLA